MATATFTASSYLAPAKTLHAGANIRFGKYTTTLAAQGVVQMFKLPHGATITRATLAKTESQAELIAQIRKWSSTASDAVTILTTTASASGLANLLPTNVGYKLSLSDTNPIRFAAIEIAAVSASVSGTKALVLEYVLDDVGN